MSAFAPDRMEIKMRRSSIVLASFVMAALAGASPAAAEPLPYIDQDDAAEGVGDGDHVVGEELCARPDPPEPNAAAGSPRQRFHTVIASADEAVRLFRLSRV